MDALDKVLEAYRQNCKATGTPTRFADEATADLERYREIEKRAVEFVYAKEKGMVFMHKYKQLVGLLSYT